MREEARDEENLRRKEKGRERKIFMYLSIFLSFSFILNSYSFFPNFIEV